jgi:ABC-type multidrug transport system fused ATPase/permease subunit
MIIYYTNMINWPLERITQQMQDLQRAGASLVRVMGIQRIQGKIPGEDVFTAPATMRLQPGPLGVEFWKVTFGYADSVASKNGVDNNDSVVKGDEGAKGRPDGDSKKKIPPAPSSEVDTISAAYQPSGPNGKTTNDALAVIIPTAVDVSTGDVAAAAFAAAAHSNRRIESELETDSEKELVLRNISFRLEPGRVIGLLGRTGSGKTTLTRLIFRLYDPDNGSIRLGSHSYDDESGMTDIRKLPVQELRRRVGMVTQNIQLFNASVRDNMTFFDSSIPDEKIITAIHDLGLGQWYDTLPKGLDTELESGGGGLSAGEAQLLAFTRIFLRDPGLVILDEATSRLDPATENLIERAVDKLTRDRTAIIVAHRLGTVQRADDILILEDGEVVEYGDRRHLAEDPFSRFYHLLQTGMEEVLA